MIYCLDMLHSPPYGHLLSIYPSLIDNFYIHSPVGMSWLRPPFIPPNTVDRYRFILYTKCSCFWWFEPPPYQHPPLLCHHLPLKLCAGFDTPPTRSWLSRHIFSLRIQNAPPIPIHHWRVSGGSCSSDILRSLARRCLEGRRCLNCIFWAVAVGCQQT